MKLLVVGLCPSSKTAELAAMGAVPVHGGHGTSLLAGLEVSRWLFLGPGSSESSVKKEKVISPFVLSSSRSPPHTQQFTPKV